ncbi:MAG TPA: TetR/AcrR family transcriptional regulator [Acidimicrobiales bacterium]|nr:TetR/AcrR family transcriptional regulator [Acidimicrobiales bacterium]
MTLDSGVLPISVKREDPRYQRLMAATRDAARAGYENVSMRELAETCHISLRTIYRRFCRSKDQLIAEAHLDGLHAFSDRLKQQPPAGSSPTERVIRVLRTFTNALEADESRSRTMLRALYSPDASDGEQRSLVAGAFSGMVDVALAGDVDESHREAVISTLAHVLNSAILGWLNGGQDVAWVNTQVETTVRLLFDPRSPKERQA